MSSEEKHHHKKKEDGDKAATGGKCGGARGFSETVTADLSGYEVFARQQKLDLGETGGDFDDLYDEGEAKKDPEHEHRHKITGDVAATAAEGAGRGGYTFPEHHDKKDQKEAEEASGEKKHHHLFG